MGIEFSKVVQMIFLLRDDVALIVAGGIALLHELEELHEQSLVRIHVVDGARSPLALYYELKLGDISATAL